MFDYDLRAYSRRFAYIILHPSPKVGRIVRLHHIICYTIVYMRFSFHPLHYCTALFIMQVSRAAFQARSIKCFSSVHFS